MANIKSAKKRIRVIDKKTARNRRIKNHLKTVLKDFEAALAEGNMETAGEKLKLAEKKLMQAHQREPSIKILLRERSADLQSSSTTRNKTHPGPHRQHKLNAAFTCEVKKTKDVSPFVF